MSSADVPAGFLPNPDYGAGVARRHVRLTGSPGCVVGELEDMVHGMRCVVSHAGGIVTAIRGEMIRIPMNTCAGAPDALQAMVGMPVDADFRTVYGNGRARANCTHLFDIAWLALRHSARGSEQREYRFAMPDAVAGAASVTLHRDDALILDWSVADDIIVSGGGAEGQNLLSGFTRWALDTLSDDLLEAALVAQKAYFVAQARRVILDGSSSPAAETERHGVCYGFDPERVGRAYRLPRPSHPTFTGSDPDVFLRFLPDRTDMKEAVNARS